MRSEKGEQGRRKRGRRRSKKTGKNGGRRDQRERRKGAKERIMRSSKDWRGGKGKGRAGNCWRGRERCVERRGRGAGAWMNLE